MNCPKCNSENTQKFSVIYESGTSKINLQSQSFGAGLLDGLLGNQGGVGAAHTDTKGVSQTVSANQTSPPLKKSNILAYLLIGAGIVSFIIDRIPIQERFIGLASLGGGGYLFYINYIYNKKQWPEFYNAWMKMWKCNKCGNTFSE